MKRVTLGVEGMSCDGCANAVRRAVGQLEGVSQVDVSLPEKRVAVSFDEAKTGEPAIRTAIEDAGYDVVGG